MRSYFPNSFFNLFQNFFESVCYFAIPETDDGDASSHQEFAPDGVMFPALLGIVLAAVDFDG